MRLVLINREQLQRIGSALVDELDNLVSRIRGSWRIEHTDEGGHGDITADTITLTGPGSDPSSTSGEIRLFDELDRAVTLDASNGGNPNNQWLAVATSSDLVTTDPTLIDRATVVRMGVLEPNVPTMDLGTGFLLRKPRTPLSDTDGWIFGVFEGDSLLTGTSMFAITNVREGHGVLFIRPTGTAGAVTKYSLGPKSTYAGSATVDLGENASGERFNNIYGVNLQALTSFTLGSATTAGVRLGLDGSGVLEVREGDNSGYGDIKARVVTATSTVVAEQVQVLSAGPTYLILGETGAAANQRYWANYVSGQTFNFYSLLDNLGAQTHISRITRGGQYQFVDGDVATPTLSFLNDTNTGIYRPTTDQIGIALGGANAATFGAPAGGLGNFLAIPALANGTGTQGGSVFFVGRNTSGSGAAACLMMEQGNGTDQFLWVDNSSLLRIGTGRPTEDNTTVSHTSGTVVGDQTSQRSAKHVIGERTDTARALKTILDTPVFDFTYRDGRYNGETFTGITTNDSPVFSKDQGRSFNEINAFGYLVNAMKEQQKQIEELRELLAARTPSRVSRWAAVLEWITRQWRTRT